MGVAFGDSSTRPRSSSTVHIMAPGHGSELVAGTAAAARYEGQGPDHFLGPDVSRFCELGCLATSSCEPQPRRPYFHLLRSQSVSTYARPPGISPPSPILRSRAARTRSRDLTEGHFGPCSTTQPRTRREALPAGPFSRSSGLSLPGSRLRRHGPPDLYARSRRPRSGHGRWVRLSSSKTRGPRTASPRCWPATEKAIDVVCCRRTREPGRLGLRARPAPPTSRDDSLYDHLAASSGSPGRQHAMHQLETNDAADAEPGPFELIRS